MLLNCTIIGTTVPNSFLHFQCLFVIGQVPTSGHVTLTSPMSVSAYQSFHCKHKNLIKMFLCLELWFLFFLMPIKLTQLTENESFDEYKLWTVRIKSPNLLSVLTWSTIKSESQSSWLYLLTTILLIRVVTTIIIWITDPSLWDTATRNFASEEITWITTFLRWKIW